MIERYVALCLDPQPASLRPNIKRGQQYAVLDNDLHLILARGSPHCAGSDFADWLCRTGCNGFAGTFVIDYSVPWNLTREEHGWMYKAARMSQADQDTFTEWLYVSLRNNAQKRLR